MKEEKRTVRVDSYFSPSEYKMLQSKMTEAGVTNLSAFIRKMALDGYLLRLDLPEVKEMVSLLRHYGNNLNQIARRVNETGRFYDADLEKIQQGQEKLWEGMNKILCVLAKLE